MGVLKPATYEPVELFLLCCIFPGADDYDLVIDKEWKLPQGFRYPTELTFVETATSCGVRCTSESANGINSAEP